MRFPALIGALAGALALALPATASAQFLVTHTFDIGPGSLREAIVASNATPGADAIAFTDLGPTPKIAPTSPLPDITDPVTIDGYTHPGASPNTASLGNNAVIKVELSGENLTDAGLPGLFISSGGTTVRGLAINRFPGTAIRLDFGDGNRIEGNFIGTDTAGTGAAENAIGVEIAQSSSNNVVGGTTAAARNVIAGNGVYGVSVRGADTTFNHVNGNYIGVTKSGLAALPNGSNAIQIVDADDTEVGGAGVLARNVIAVSDSAGWAGILVQGSSAERTQIRGNYIGTNRNGSAKLGVAGAGIDIQGARDTRIGGTSPGEGNVIAGASRGITIVGGPTTVQGNRIGTNAAGTAALGNSEGIGVFSAGGDLIGGTDPGAGNLISGNVRGIVAGGPSLTVQGNFIGTDATGNGPLPNVDGIVGSRADNLRVGGDVADARNVIAGNERFGVLLSLGDQPRVEGNFIGVGANGTTPVGNGTGVLVEPLTPGVEIGGTPSVAGAPPGNVISGNLGSGIVVRGSSDPSSVIQGNLIGTNAAGTDAVGNGEDGISLRHGARDVLVGNPTGNVISGNVMAGVYIADAEGNQLRANHIGVNRSGTIAIPNGTGVELASGARDTRIGLETRLGNVISGNRDEGVLIHGAGTTANSLNGNLIGLRADGTAAVPNGKGVVISGGAFENWIGDQFTLDPAANTISGNRTDGVLITGAETNRNVVYRDLIGTRSNGVGALPNAVGVTITGGARQNTVDASTVSGNRTAGVRIAGAETFGNRVISSAVGTTRTGTAIAIPNGTGVIVTAGARSTALRGNRIALNTASGVLVDGATTGGAELIQNRIFGNGQLGINLRGAGEGLNVVTPNDAGDVDTGPNDLQNFPVITAANGVPAGTTVSGTLNSRPGQRYRIELFRNPVASGAAAEGETYAGAVTVTTDAGGNAAWSLSIPGDRTGEVLRATATRLTTRDTSELSLSRVVG